MQKSDVTIIGGGIIGLIFAARLSYLNPGLDIVIVQDKMPLLDWPQASLPDRVSALNHFSQNLLTSLNLWTDIWLEAVPYFQMFVWDKVTESEILFDRNTVNKPDLGHIVTNRLLQKVLWSHVQSNPHIDLEVGAIPESIQVNEENVVIQLSGGKNIQSALLVGADGASSWVHQQMGFKRYTSDYHQVALTAVVQTEKSHAHQALQCFSEEEVLAFLPMKDKHQSFVVWSVVPERLEMLKKLSSSDFCSALSGMINHRLGKVQSAQNQLFFPLKMQHSQSYVQPRVALIGDAIHTIHPLAGQGLNLGIQDADDLANCIHQAALKGKELGAFSTLRRYERSRVGANWKMIAAMEGMKYFFCHKAQWLKPIRRMGMGLVNQVHPLKRWLVNEALFTHL